MDIAPRKRVETAVWRLGGVAQLAGALGVSKQAIWKWQAKDEIPAKWQSTLLDIAKQSGIELTAEDLIGG